MFRKMISLLVAVSFLMSMVVPPRAYAQGIIGLPEPGAMLPLNQQFNPVMLKGLKIHPENPFAFGFIMDTGDSGFKADNPDLRKESQRLIKYFFATLAIPEKDLWVNLSPYEKDRMIPEQLGKTELGRDMLAQDYILKQVTATLVHPDSELGKDFWKRVYEKAAERFGSTQIPVDTFNKVWIIPDKAVVYESNGTAFVLESHLKVMLAEDYLAMSNNSQAGSLEAADETDPQQAELRKISASIVKEIVIPELEKEVNTGKNFSAIRQMANAMVLATWFKKALKDTLLGQLYVDQNKVRGIDLSDPKVSQKIYQQYLEAYRKGAFNFIKEDVDTATREIVPRKYFSGGVDAAQMDRNTEVVYDFDALSGTAKETARGLRANQDALVLVDAAMVGKTDDQAEPQEVVFSRNVMTNVNARLAGLDKVIVEVFGTPKNRNLSIVRDSTDQPVPLVDGKRLPRPNNLIIAPAVGGNYVTGVQYLGSTGLTAVRMTVVLPEEGVSKEAANARMKEKVKQLGLGDDLQILPEKKSGVSARARGKKAVIINENETAVVSVPGVGTMMTLMMFYDTGNVVNPFQDGLGALEEFQTPPVEKIKEPQTPLLRKIRVGMYGLGRTGITTLRQLLLSNSPEEMEVVAVLYDAEETRARFILDSVYNDFPGTVSEVQEDEKGKFFNVTVGAVTHKVYALAHDRTKGLTALPWAKFNIDVAVDATGIAKTHEDLMGHIKAGAKRAMVSAPSKVDKKAKGPKKRVVDYEAIVGINEDLMPIDAVTLSNASCTTNGFAPVLEGVIRLAHSLGGRYLSGDMLTAHAITGTQALTDSKPYDKEGAAAMLNMIDATTGAGGATAPLMEKVGIREKIKELVSAVALRIPTPTGSAIIKRNIVRLPEGQKLTAEDVNNYFRSLAEGDLKGILAVESGVISSLQITGRSAATIILPEQTTVEEIEPGVFMVSILTWYDNEWGYSSQLARMVRVVGAKLIEREVRDQARPLSDKKNMADLLAQDLRGKKIAVRVDYNVPIRDGKVQDTTRLQASLLTIQALIQKGAKVVLMSHLERPKDLIAKFIGEGKTPEEAKALAEKALTLAPVAPVLQDMLSAKLGKAVKVAFDTKYRTMANAADELASMANGDVLLLENTRFADEEEKNGPIFASDLFEGADAFVLDGASVIHRAHASVMAVPGIQRFMGYALQDELGIVDDVSKEAVLAVIGGAKVVDKIGVIREFLDANPDRKVLIGGAMANAFQVALGRKIGASIGGDAESAKVAAELLKKYGDRIVLPTGFKVVDDFANPRNSVDKKATEDTPDGESNVDIDDQTAEEYTRLIQSSLGPVFWNGPMGAFDKLPQYASSGTRKVAAAIASIGKRGVVGGGDSVTAYNTLLSEGVRQSSEARILTGGGASLEGLEGKPLPGVQGLTPRPTTIEELTSEQSSPDPITSTWLEAIVNNSDKIDWKTVVPRAVVKANEARQERAPSLSETRTAVSIYGRTITRGGGPGDLIIEVLQAFNAGVSPEAAGRSVVKYSPLEGVPTDQDSLTMAINVIRGVLIHRYGFDIASRIPVTYEGSGQAPTNADNAQVGGIDLNSALLNLQIKRDGKGVPLPLNMQPIGNVEMKVFYPVIINITPAVDITPLLGIKELEEAGKVASI